MPWLVFAIVALRNKFEMATFTRSKKCRGSQNYIRDQMSLTTTQFGCIYLYSPNR